MIWLALAAAASASTCVLPSSGAWTYQQPQYRHLGDTLSVSHRNGHWSARIGHDPLRVQSAGSRLTLSLPSGSRFEGSKVGSEFDGFWIEPKSAFDHSRAFRVSLRSSERGWTGIIAPDEDRVRLNVWLLNVEGKPQVLVRNPDGLIGDTRFSAEPSGCGYNLQDVNDSPHRARLDFAGSTAHLRKLSDKLPDLPLAGVDPLRRTTLPTNSDWQMATPEAEGLDRHLLDEMMSSVAANDPTTRGVPLIHSILVARHGKLVAERYFAGYSADDLHELRSLSKSFVPLLAGAAITHRVRISANTTLGESLAQYAALLRANPTKAQITFEELLAMRSGLACDDFDDESPGGEDRMQAQSAEPDWYRYFLGLPVVNPPGSHYAYCSAGTHLAAGVIAAQANRTALDLFDQWIAGPLGITEYSMPLDPEGRAYFGGGAHMRPRDVLKIGQLVLNGGRWGDRQVVDARWLAKAVSCPAAEPACSEGLAWHFNMIQANGRSYREIEANGNGGQLLMLFPELDLAIMITAANFNAYPVWRKFREDLVPRYVLAGLRQ